MLLFCMAAGKFMIKLANDNTVKKLSIRMSDTQVTCDDEKQSSLYSLMGGDVGLFLR